MVFEIIITGLGELFGYGIFIFMMLIFTFFIFLMSKGVGLTSLIVTLFLTAYLFATNEIGNNYIVSHSWLITILILLGLFAGFIIYNLFFTD